MRLILGLSLIVLCAPPAFGRQWLEQCNKSVKESNDHCDTAVNNAKKTEAATAASGSALSGTDINKNSNIEKTAIGAQDTNLANAIGACQAALDKCKKDCQEQKQQAEAASSTPGPTGQLAKQDAGQIPMAEKMRCEGDLQKKIADLNKDKSPLNGQQKEAQNTGQATPSMPSGGSGSNGDGTNTPSDTASSKTPDQSTCSTTGSGTNCSTSSTTTPQSSDQGQAGFSTPKTTDGTKPASSTDSAATDALRNGVSTGAATTGYGGGSGGGGGGGSLGGSSATNVAGLAGGANGNGSAREGTAGTGIGSLGVEGGGGGGGGGSGGSSGDSSGYSVATTNFGRGKEKPLLPAAPMAGSQFSDRSQPNGPSIFYIQSAAIGSYCTKKGVKRTCAN